LEIIFGSIFNIYHSTSILCCTTGVGGRVARGAQTPINFDLVKIRAKSLTNQANTVEIWAKSLNIFKIPENLSKPLKV